METLGEMFRMVLQRLTGQRLMDVSVADDDRVLFLFENGDEIHFDAFSYKPVEPVVLDNMKGEFLRILGDTETTRKLMDDSGNALHFSLEDEDDDDDDN
jgi:hypothetical protein